MQVRVWLFASDKANPGEQLDIGIRCDVLPVGKGGSGESWATLVGIACRNEPQWVGTTAVLVARDNATQMWSKRVDVDASADEKDECYRRKKLRDGQKDGEGSPGPKPDTAEWRSTR